MNINKYQGNIQSGYQQTTFPNADGEYRRYSWDASLFLPLYIYSDVDIDEVYSPMSWITYTQVTNSSGYIKIQNNKSKWDRTGLITFTGSDGETETIRICQAHYDDIKYPTPSNTIIDNIPMSGATETVAVNNYVGGSILTYEVSEDDVVSGVTYNENGFTFNILPNDTGNEKLCDITVVLIDSAMKVENFYQFDIMQLAESRETVLSFITPNDIDYNAQNVNIEYIARNVTINNISLNSEESTDGITMLSYDDSKVVINVPKLSDDENRDIIATFEVRYIPAGEEEGIIDTFGVRFSQKSKPETIIFPLWKTTEYTFDVTVEPIKFQLTTENDEVIYDGILYSNGEVIPTLRFNDIIKNYITQKLNIDSDNNLNSSNGLLRFKLYVEGLFRCILVPYNDWSYDDSERIILSKPVSNVLDSRQILLTSFRSLDCDTDTQIQLGGSNKSGRPYANKNYFISEDVAHYVKKDISNYRGIWFNLTDDSISYTVKETCNRYCLYYRNIYGGYDSMLFAQTAKQTDTLENNKYLGQWNTTNPFKGGYTHYSRSITEKIALKSGYLTDEQALLFADAMKSPEVYIQDLEDGQTLYHCIIDGQSIERKTFKNNSKKFIQYTLTVQKSIIKEIR